MGHNCAKLVKLRVDIEQEAVLHTSRHCGLKNLKCVRGVVLSQALIYMAPIRPLFLATLLLLPLSPGCNTCKRL